MTIALMLDMTVHQVDYRIVPVIQRLFTENVASAYARVQL